MKRPLPSRASTLLLALWALFLLSAAVLAWAKWVDRGLEDARVANLALEARALAHSGVAVVLNPGVTRRTPALKAELEPERSYEVTIEGEGGKLNLSYLTYREDPARLEVLKSYLALRGLTFEEREAFIDGLLDWIDTDNVRRLNGAEEGAGYKPGNRPVTSLEEIPQIHGAAPLVERYPAWRDDLTLLSTGPLDLESAPADLLGLIPGVGQVRAEAFVRLRQGQDGEDGTDDDRIFNDLNDAVGALGLSQEQFALIPGLLSFRDPIIRIRSVGTAGNVRRQVDVVARKVQGANPRILLWTEK